MEKSTEINSTTIRIKGGWIYAFFKRLFDFFSSLIAIIILSPLMIILCLLVLLTSRGHVFFCDKRVGKRGKKIKIFKFRTMYRDANTNPEKYFTDEQMNQWNTERKVEHDPRITKVGKFLRKTSLDELPQLFNILFGTISIVGPRPISEAELDLNFTKNERELLLSVKPGLIGCWAVYGRSEISFASGKRQELEISYLYKRSLFYDLKLIFLAVPAVLKSKGAK